MQHKLKRPTQIKSKLLLLLALMAMPLAALAQPTVTLQTTDGDAAEAGQDPGSFVVERTSDVNFDQQLNVLVARTGSATQFGDYTITPFTLNAHPNIYQVTIPAGQARTVVTLTPVTDNRIEGVENAIFTLVNNAAYLTGDNTEAVIEITDDVAEVVLTLDDGNAAEAGQDPGSFTVTRTSNGKFDAALHVLVTRNGTATQFGDYTITPFILNTQPNVYSVTIPANQTSQTVILTPVTDNLIEDVENAEFKLIGDSKTYTTGADTDAVIEISDDVAEVVLTLNDGDAAEAGQDPGSFTVTRTSNGKFNAALHVLVTRNGTATQFGDYTITPFILNTQPNVYSVTIPANQTSQTVILTPVTDNLIEDVENAEFKLVGDSKTYTTGADTDAVIEISDDVAEVVLTLDDGSAAEAGQDPGSFTVTRTSNGKFDAALHVLVTRNGTATQFGDYTITPFILNTQPNVYSVTIPANQASQTVTLTPVLDSDETEGEETAEFNLIGDGKSYIIGGDTEAIIVIADYTDIVFKDSFETP